MVRIRVAGIAIVAILMIGLFVTLALIALPVIEDYNFIHTEDGQSTGYLTGKEAFEFWSESAVATLLVQRLQQEVNPLLGDDTAR